MSSAEVKEITQATVNAKDAAQYVGVSYWMILEMVKRKQIPCIKCGSRKLFRIASLDKWMQDQESNVVASVEAENNEYGVLRKIY